MTGAIEPVGYHRGIVHVGVLTASPDAVVLWQEVGLSAVLTVTVGTFAVAGSVVISLLGGGVRSRRGKLS
jgi:ABC-type hemin transport system substrate-binding protein